MLPLLPESQYTPALWHRCSPRPCTSALPPSRVTHLSFEELMATGSSFLQECHSARCHTLAKAKIHIEQRGEKNMS
uniref:Uncharacterized protein n=1 Tax=Zea mays TaxID=4577 RepID=A0A804MT49_MAIZE